MYIKSLSLIAVLSLLHLNGCSAPQPAAPTAPAEKPAAVEDVNHDEANEESAEPHTLSPISLDAYTIKPIQMGGIHDGHVNIHVEGGEVKAVRAWVGDEAATDVMVTLANWEDDHHCAHIEVPDTLPEGAKLWVEIDTPDGNSLSGSTDIAMDTAGDA